MWHFAWTDVKADLGSGSEWVFSVVVETESWSALVVDDDPGVRQSLRLCLEADGARVLGVGSAAAALEALERGSFDLVLVDVWLGQDSGLDAIADIRRRQPSASIIVITALATFESAVDAMKRGAFDYLPKPFTPDQVRHAARRALEATRTKQQLAEVKVRLQEAGTDDDFFETASPQFQMVLAQARRVSSTDVPVLLRGESGTGKNVMARWLWQQSSRARGPFVSVSCPSLSPELMNSTLFGHKKGAFTGAVGDAEGKVQEAKGGLLFLDEVGDLSLEAQARLLRFLNDRSYERVGEPKERHADVRIVAATNRSLEEDLKAGRLREDLFYRLNVVSLVLPALRDRREDLLALARHYLNGAPRPAAPARGFLFRGRRASHRVLQLARKSARAQKRRGEGSHSLPGRSHRTRRSGDPRRRGIAGGARIESRSNAGRGRHPRGDGTRAHREDHRPRPDSRGGR